VPMNDRMVSLVSLNFLIGAGEARKTIGAEAALLTAA